MSILAFVTLFLGKVTDNILDTTRIIFTQRNRPIIAAFFLVLTNFVSYNITKAVVNSNMVTIIVVSIASGVGCYIAIKVSNKKSKDRTYVNIVMNDNIEDMQNFHQYLTENHIVHVVTDSYCRDLTTKALTITIYSETKEQSRIIDEYSGFTEHKFKRIVQGNS